MAGLDPASARGLAGARAAAVGICDARRRQREQSDRKHDERAVQ